MKDKTDLFEKFLATSNTQISITDFLFNSVLIVILSFLLERTYAKCGKSLSNRKVFAGNFMLLAFTTMLIINIVKSSLALSLGLVGALSIVRFRSAIKEPEELAYLFLTISLGLGLGANQRIITIVAFIIIMIILWVRYFFSQTSKNQNLFFTVSSNSPSSIQLNEIVEIVKNNFDEVELRRFDENPNIIEAAFMIDADSSDKLEKCKNQLQEISNSVSVTFIDSKSY